MNELEIRGLKDLIKEVIEEETDYKTRLDDLEEDIQELRGEKPDSEYQDEEDEENELPEEEPLEDNPKRQEYEEDLEKAAQKESGARISKEDMGKLQKGPSKKVKSPVEKAEDTTELDEENWDEEQ